MNKRTVYAAVLLTTASLALAGCSNPRDSSSSSDGAGGTHKFRIGLASASYGPYLPVYVAQQEGYFADHGLDVEITAYQGGGAATEALSAGNADLISYNPEGVAVARAHGIKATLVATGMPTSSGWYVVVPKDSTAKDLSDLAGKKVGIGNPGGTGEFFALWAQKSAGVEWQNDSLGYGALNESLKRGSVDAIVQLPPLSYQPVLDGSGRVLSDLADAMKPTIPDGWVASDDEISDRADDVKAALAAIFEGVAKLQSDKAYALEIIKDKEGISGELAEQEYQNTIMAISKDGSIDPAWIDNALDLAHDADLDNGIDLPSASEVYTDEFVPATTK